MDLFSYLCGTNTETMKADVKATKTALKKFGRTNVKNSILDGEIIFTSYREYDGYCECDLIYTGKIYEGRGNYLPGRWLNTGQITPEDFSLNKVTRAIRVYASKQALTTIKQFGVSLPVKIKKVKIC